MFGMGGVVGILLAELFERFGAVGVRMPRAGIRILALQQIDHQSVAQAARRDKYIIETDLGHDLVQHQSACDDDVGALWIAADHVGSFRRGAAHEQIEQRFQALAPEHGQRTGFAVAARSCIGFGERRDRAAAAEGHGEFLFLNAPRHGFHFVANMLAQLFHLLVLGRIVGQKFFGETHGAERQTK